METRRKKLGKRIQRDRMMAGYDSARAFAEAITARYTKISERSVAGAETGEERVGRKTYGLIEKALGYSTGSFALYLETGDEAVLSERVTSPAPRRPDQPRRLIDMTRADLFDIATTNAEVDGQEAANQWLVRALLKQAELRRLASRHTSADQTFESDPA